MFWWGSWSILLCLWTNRSVRRCRCLEDHRLVPVIDTLVIGLSAVRDYSQSEQFTFALLEGRAASLLKIHWLIASRSDARGRRLHRRRRQIGAIPTACSGLLSSNKSP